MTLPLLASVVGGLLACRHFSLRKPDPLRFLATVSHELRTPLHVILGWVSLLKSGTLQPAETAHALESIERNAQLQTRLVDELLDASRVLGGRTSLDLAPTDVRAAVRAAAARVSPVARAKGVQLVVANGPGETTISGDGRRLTDAVWHLLSNAVQFTPAGGEVRIDLETRGGLACLRVADTGEGIASKDLPHVFEPFLQGQTRMKRAGLGLGLAVVRAIVKRHRGTISAYSAGRGQGAVFRITLPLVNSRFGLPETKEQ